MIPFNRPHVHAQDIEHMELAVRGARLSGDGPYTRRCHAWLESHGTEHALLTTSCTSALEMATLLAELGPGDEVILPSFTFVSTANAVVLRGATPVFVDIDPRTQNLDPRAAEAAIGPRTKAIIVVHYAGVACDMDAFTALAEAHDLWLIEDAAQGVGAKYRDQVLGTIGHVGAYSFHETKNISCGEGGALLIQHEAWKDRADILWEKGTNRRRFFRGEIDKYTWVDVGSSFLMSDFNAAFLFGQLERADEINANRMATWQAYDDALRPLSERYGFAVPHVPDDATHNAHIYYIVVEGLDRRTKLIHRLLDRGVHGVFHYVPLHSSPGGQKFGRVGGELTATNRAGEGLVRLPLWWGMPAGIVAEVISVASQVLEEVH